MDIVIIGAGQAAASMAAKLRTLGHTGALSIIGDEPVAPYQRPPLSKAYLLGEIPVERLTLRDDRWWRDKDIQLLTGHTVTHIDRETKQVRIGSHRTLPYDQLALTLGATPRKLPEESGGKLAGVHYIRNLANITQLASGLSSEQNLVVIGGGYIGLEAASVARKLGLDVTLIEAAPRILNRVASAETATMIRELHQAHGVEIVEGESVDRLIGENTVTGVALSNGRKIDTNLVVLGVGAVPETMLAEEAGLSIDNGISCDSQGRTSDPAIWAAGDCASFPWQGNRIRLESVGNAIDMGELVAENILGAGNEYNPKPWFWSDQYDAKLQIAGLHTGYDQVVTRRGDGANTGSVWYYADSRLIAVDALNDGRAYMVGKRLIDAGKSADPARVADPATPLKELL